MLLNHTQVVEADSAKIGDGREEVGSIPANHSKMTKFSSRSDIGYKRVSAQIRRWVEEINGANGVCYRRVSPCHDFWHQHSGTFHTCNRFVLTS